MWKLLSDGAICLTTNTSLIGVHVLFFFFFSYERSLWFEQRCLPLPSAEGRDVLKKQSSGPFVFIILVVEICTRLCWSFHFNEITTSVLILSKKKKNQVEMESSQHIPTPHPDVTDGCAAFWALGFTFYQTGSPSARCRLQLPHHGWKLCLDSVTVQLPDSKRESFCHSEWQWYLFRNSLGFFFVQFFWKRPKSALGSALSRARSRPCQNSLKPSAGWKMDVATVKSPVDLSSPARAERFPVTILVFWTRGGNRHSLARQSQAVDQRAGFRRPSFLTHRITQIY